MSSSRPPSTNSISFYEPKLSFSFFLLAETPHIKSLLPVLLFCKKKKELSTCGVWGHLGQCGTQSSINGDRRLLLLCCVDRSAITIFPQRTDGKHDFRIWNPQIISYAGYRLPDGTIQGDPANADFTEVCLKLGWKGPSGQLGKWDILPLVLSADGHDPEYFEIPRELILEVPITHPA
jgi:hypothetical protein